MPPTQKRQQVPIDPDDPGFGRVLMAFTWIFTLLCIPAVCGRFYLRRRFSVPLSFDDWTMLAAAIFQIVYQVSLTVAYTWGLGKQVQNVTATDLVNVTKWIFVGGNFSTPVSVVARISIAIFLVRIFGTRRWYKRFLIYFTALIVIVGVVNIILLDIQVIPIEGLWNPEVQPSFRIDNNIQVGISHALQILQAVSDLAYVIFPVVFIWKLNMALRRKIGLVLLILVSIITFAAALTKVVLVSFSYSLLVGDPLLYLSAISLLSGLEQSFVIITGCVPTLRPITQLEFPMIRTIASSFTNLISRGRSTDSERSETGAYYRFHSPNHSASVGMELPKLRPSDETSLRPAPTVTTANDSVHTRSIANGYIQRTDNFTIDYSSNPRQQPNV